MDFQKKMQAPIEIEKLMKKGERDDIVANIFYFFMFEGHQQYSEIKKMPIPLAFDIMKLYEKKQKEIEKQIRKKK